MDILDASRLDDSHFDAALRLCQQLDRAWDPDLAPRGAEELRLLFTADETENAEHFRNVAFADGRPVAIGHLELTRDIANPELAALEIDLADADLDSVGPVLATLLERAAAAGRTSVLAYGPHDEVRDRMWNRFGATCRMIDRDSDLFLDRVDAEMMQAWVDQRTQRAASVRLVGWTGEVPDEHLDAFVVSTNAMNDAPLDDLEIEDFVMTGELVRHEARARAALGWETDVLMAIEEDGSPVGHTTVMVNRHRPEASWQWDTVVLDQHRRRGVGRWLKAAMWFHLRRDRPRVTRLRTSNAESNDPMLAINEAMGFRPAHRTACWQGDLDAMRAEL